MPPVVAHRLAALRRGAARRFVRWVRETPARDLERLDGWRARVIVEGLFLAMPLALDRRRAARVRTAVEWRVTEPDGGATVRTTVVRDGRMRVRRGVVAEPDLTLVVELADLLRLAAGTEHAAALFMQGRLKLDGDPTVALRLGRLFRVG